MVEAGSSNNAIEVALRRHRDGIKVRVKVWPEVEAFFERWSGGSQERTTTHGRLWKPVGEDDLRVWSLGLSSMAPSPARPFSLFHTGAGFTVEGNMTNISFLRLVGTSSEEGRSFIVEAVIGRSELAQLAQRISDACNVFYSEYLQPVNLKAFVGVYSLPVAAEDRRAA